MNTWGKVIWPKGKIWMVFGLIGLYVLVAIALQVLVYAGVVDRLQPTPLDVGGNDSVQAPPSVVVARFEAAQRFMDERLIRSNGHVDLYWFVHGEAGNTSVAYAQHDNTNSEAVSYRLFIAAKAQDKAAFDTQLAFMEQYMLEPNYGYMMWRLESDNSAQGEGRNIAPDADLRTIEALMIAEDQWGDKKYTEMIDTLAHGLEELAVTNDGLLAAYGGVSGPDSTWTTNEVYLSYAHFNAFRELSKRRGEPWTSMYEGMKEYVLEAQLQNGLYNSQLTEARDFGNGIDSGGYAINSMWVMVRNAESGDPELMASAQKSLDFFKERYFVDAEIYTMYDSSGNALSSGEAPWVYALVGRAAVALGDEEFSKQMIRELLQSQVSDEESVLYGAFPEGGNNDLRVGQFTMQESMMTLQDYIAMEQRSLQ